MVRLVANCYTPLTLLTFLTAFTPTDHFPYALHILWRALGIFGITFCTTVQTRLVNISYTGLEADVATWQMENKLVTYKYPPAMPLDRS